ncbi:helix-turn-helix domain-containing protein [Bacteroides fragilis]|uniref:Uncharacterized protein n=1 Tax=Bacteroides fragilis TaxID=817 RepID=A0AAP9CYW6_BACFG|nr:helix-turn-helix domain-containing protein [Bacteroides fragilis]MCE8582594.1 helix-turn-helix domain-containing protein [Bacteroides fragilis]MCE8603632.1 helix-turn-helix domain-containing protein [Bacteroides fragilis]MCE8650872.1 helix-turn-helix domain-containing protein [Bacteroides fragilis]MCE8664900.1 helix-turn-helix domain-containing protein [Bacteroides fragilis]
MNTVLPLLYHIGYKSGSLLLYLCPNRYNMENQTIAEYVKQMRRETGLTQVDLSEKVGVD